MTHTPGPWQVNTSPDLSQLAVVAPSRGTGFGSSVAICTQRDGFKPLSMQEAYANCHLVAAAPDLLAAAQLAIEECCDLIGMPAGDALIAAIARATGKGD